MNTKKFIWTIVHQERRPPTRVSHVSASDRRIFSHNYLSAQTQAKGVLVVMGKTGRILQKLYIEFVKTVFEKTTKMR